MSHRLLLTPSAELMRLEEKEGSLFHRPWNNCRANRSHHYHHSSPSSAAATTAARQLHALHSLVVEEPGATEEDDERVKLIRARPNMQTMNLMLESSIFVWPLCAFLPLADISPRLQHFAVSVEVHSDADNCGWEKRIDKHLHYTKYALTSGLGSSVSARVQRRRRPSSISYRCKVGGCVAVKVLRS